MLGAFTQERVLQARATNNISLKDHLADELSEDEIANQKFVCDKGMSEYAERNKLVRLCKRILITKTGRRVSSIMFLNLKAAATRIVKKVTFHKRCKNL